TIGKVWHALNPAQPGEGRGEKPGKTTSFEGSRRASLMFCTFLFHVDLFSPQTPLGQGDRTVASLAEICNILNPVAINHLAACTREKPTMRGILHIAPLILLAVASACAESPFPSFLAVEIDHHVGN